MASDIGTLIQTTDPTKSLDNFSSDAQILFGLLTLIIDIKYRVRYGYAFEVQHGKGYSKQLQVNKVLADQISPVDDGLLGNSQREIPGL